MLRKISKILYLVGGILAFVGAAISVVAGIVCLILGALPQIHDALVQGFEQGTINSTINATPAENASFTQIMLLVSGILMLIFSLFNVVAGVFSLISRNKKSLALSIVCIILGFIAEGYIIIGGAVVGIIANSRENDKTKDDSSTSDTIEAEVVD